MMGTKLEFRKLYLKGKEWWDKIDYNNWVDTEWKDPYDTMESLNELLIRKYNIRIVAADMGADCMYYTFEPAANLEEEPHCDDCDRPMDHMDHWGEHDIYFEYWTCVVCGHGVTLRFRLYDVVENNDCERNVSSLQEEPDVNS